MWCRYEKFNKVYYILFNNNLKKFEYAFKIPLNNIVICGIYQLVSNSIEYEYILVIGFFR